ncbi:MAG: CoA transferase [Chloroflexi bacterium]|nr:CoA transferase [Chloroflexota bacterium]
MDYAANGRVQQRMGNRDPQNAPQGCYRCMGEDCWIAISVESDAQWEGVKAALGHPEWAREPAFSDALGRQRHHDELDGRIEEWTSQRDARELMALLQSHGVAAGVVLNNRDLFTDPHLKARGFFEVVGYPEHRGIGKQIQPGRPWKLSRTPSRIVRPAPSYGQDNAYVLAELLGLSATELASLVEEGVISQQPTVTAPRRNPSMDELQAAGRIIRYDTDFRQVLGLEQK